MTKRRDGRRYTEKGAALPVLGRKFCTDCGKWRHLHDFGVNRRSRSGMALGWHAACNVCKRLKQREKFGHAPRQYGATDPKILNKRAWERLKNDPVRMERKREYWRIYKEMQRREAGVKPREWRPDGPRALSPSNGRDKLVDSAPFFEWVEEWKAQHKEEGVASLARAMDVDEARFRAINGKVSVHFVDRALIAAGADTPLAVLYPELYE